MRGYLAKGRVTGPHVGRIVLVWERLLLFVLVDEWGDRLETPYQPPFCAQPLWRMLDTPTGLGARLTTNMKLPARPLIHSTRHY